MSAALSAVLLSLLLSCECDGVVHSTWEKGPLRAKRAQRAANL